MRNFSSLWHVLFLKRPAQLCYTGSLFGRLDRRNVPITQQYRSGRRRDRRTDRNRDREHGNARGYRLVPNWSRPSNRLRRWNELGLDELKIVTVFLQRSRPLSIALRVAILSSAYDFDRASPKAHYRKDRYESLLGVIGIASFVKLPPLVTRNSGFLARHEISRETKRSFSSSFCHNTGSRLGYASYDCAVTFAALNNGSCEQNKFNACTVSSFERYK